MMKADDKEKIIFEEEQKLPKIEVYTSKVLKTAKKPWFVGCCGVALASFAVLLTLIVLISILGYIGYLPEKVRLHFEIHHFSNGFYNQFHRFQMYEASGFGRFQEHEKRLNELEDRNDPRKVCMLPMDSGRCSDLLPRWYFDTKKAKCLQFVYSGCSGNANNFNSEYECNEHCFSWGDDYLYPPELDNEVFQPKKVALDACQLGPDVGPCKGSKERFYYDNNEQSCKSFTYGGCEGNRNNFLTERDCLVACKEEPPIMINERVLGISIRF